MNTDTLPLMGKYRLGWLIIFALTIMFIAGLVTGLTESIPRLSTTWLMQFGTLAVALGWGLGGAKRNKGLFFALGLIVGLCLLILVQAEISQDFYRAFAEALRIDVLRRDPQEFLPETGPLFYHLYMAINTLNRENP